MVAVKRQAGGLFAGSYRPFGLDDKLFRIDDSDFALVFDVDPHSALSIGGAPFGLASEWNGSGNLFSGRVDGGGIRRSAVEGKNTLAAIVIDDRVGISAGLNFAGWFQGVQVEDCYLVVATVAH